MGRRKRGEPLATSKFGLTPEEMADLQKTVQALKAVFCSAGDAITAAAEQLREAYLAAEAAARAHVDMEAILALFAQEAAAEEAREKVRGNPCPQPYRRPWPRETAVRPLYQSTARRSARPTARSSIKQQRNRRKP